MKTLLEKNPLRVGGLPGGAQAWWLWHNRASFPRLLALAASDEAAENLFDDFQALERWLNPSARASEAAFFSEEETDVRIAALTAWSGAGGTDRPRFLFAGWEMALNPAPAPETFRGAHQQLRLGDRKDRAEFLSRLTLQGYNRVDSVEQVGEVAVRGEVLDLWSPGWDAPLRALWPFEQIESLRKIDLATQRSGDAVESALVRPAALAAAPSGPRNDATLLSYLGPDGALFESSLPPEAAVPWDGARVARVELGGADREEPFQPAPPFGAPGTPARLDLFVAAVRRWVDDGWRVALFCANPGEQERLEEILLEHDRRLAGPLDERRIELPIGPLRRGFLDPSAKLAVLSNGEIFGRLRRRLRLPKFAGGKAMSDVAELSAGDYVVHERFGLGRYHRLERVKAGGVEADYLRLEYKGGDRVFVPLIEFKQVQKYIGADGKKPKLSSLDTSTWERTKELVQKSVAELAAELLARAAKRAALPGLGYPPDGHLEKEFGAEFHYELTPDQARAVEEVKADMVRPRPMDRLVCGDVGYGKTEVAMRAAFKAVVNQRQVALLVPTTILAEQHGRNFRERFADFPVSIAVLSRFTKPAEAKRVLADLRRGVIDVIIGTHRLLSSDVAFKNLGLVIVDEEHRFGVKQKERVAAFRDVVDVLALSATPIPRTLGAAMGGIKALSVIQSPPEGRLPISTHVGPYDEKTVLAAVEQELRRGGQVFYVHNRVGTIEKRRERLEKAMAEHGLAPKIALAHGQMSGAALEKTMWDFLHRKFNVLLSTSIIESGLDIPTVNTLIVEDAEDFGLSQLYQLRGRVGRERQKAYCFLFYSGDAALSDDAKKRLSALKEFASLGSGFRLALRDLEIRGAGNLLGPQQHGFMNAVGMDLYGQLLSDEIARQRDGAAPAEEEKEPELELPVSAYLPEDYVPSEAERVAFYRRLLDTEPRHLASLREELEDRCGRLPPPAERLFAVAALRRAAKEKKVLRIGAARKGLEVRFREDASFPPEALEKLMAEHGGRFAFLPGPPFGMRFGPPAPEDPVEWTRRFLEGLPVPK